MARRFWEWILFLGVIAVLSGCIVKKEEETAALPAQTKSIEPISSIEASDTRATISANAPAITEVHFPEVIISQVTPGLGEVHFIDLEGDIYSVQFTLMEGGCAESDYFAFDPMDALSEGETKEGTFSFEQYCVKCAGSAGDLILMQVQLFDEAGHVSAPAEYSFLCE